MIKNPSVLKQIFKKKIDYYTISKKDFDEIIEKLSKKQQNSYYYDFIKQEIESSLNLNMALLEDEKIDYSVNIKTNNIVNLVDNFLEKAILLKASDIHFNPVNQNVDIKIRVEGNLIEIDKIQKEIYEKVASRIKVLSGMDITKQMTSQDGKFTFSYNNYDYDIRSSIIPTLYGERITLRILDNSTTSYVLEDVFMIDSAKAEIEKNLSNQNGLILVVGPTGSGKTTTLYSLIKKKINDNVNIITVEDPIEYTIGGITQVQINDELGNTYVDSLRSALRQDPDVFMIGEIRDKEAAEITVRSALTGHLVFSTIHANDSVSAIYRLIDFGISPNLIVNSLRVVIYQKLFKKVCPYCKGQKEEECGYCNNTGEKGRLCISEVLIIDDDIKKSIIEGNIEEVLKNKKTFVEINKVIELARNKKIIK